jgi:hypothetical protein
MPLYQRGARISTPSVPDRWIIIRKLGEGQFAEVYEVKDSTVKDRDVRVRGISLSGLMTYSALLGALHIALLSCHLPL